MSTVLADKHRISIELLEYAIPCMKRRYQRIRSRIGRHIATNQVNQWPREALWIPPARATGESVIQSTLTGDTYCFLGHMSYEEAAELSIDPLPSLPGACSVSCLISTFLTSTISRSPLYPEDVKKSRTRLSASAFAAATSAFAAATSSFALSSSASTFTSRSFHYTSPA